VNNGSSQPIANVRTRDERTPRSALEFVLPDLDESVDGAIQSENLSAIEALYFVYMLEEMQLVQVAERIVELFREGLLPVGPGRARDFLSTYDRWSADRISAAERRDFYAQAFGAPGGASDSEPNRDFDQLWLRFLAAVSSLVRPIGEARPSDDAMTLPALQDAARKASRDLATNLSQHGYGITYMAATELAQTILELRDLLRDAGIQAAFGARDMWQVIDRINAEYLGGARNTNRYRTQAKAGAVIIRWIGNNLSRLASASGDVIDVGQLSRPEPHHAGHNPTVDPTDRDLVDACEQWLAVGGVQEESVA
jgi:hypothetical protein